MKLYSCLIALCLVLTAATASADKPAGEGWTSLYNGKDFTNWKNPNTEIWTIQDGVIDCNPRADIKGDKDLWSEKEYDDIEFYVEWRIKETKGLYDMPVVLPDGTEKKDENGKFIIQSLPNADSGIYLRGDSKNQVNIWCWPVGSGEVYGYRTDKTQPAAVRAGVTPKLNADKPVGEWNSFLITMKGDLLTVVLNGKTVLENAQLPGIAPKGPVALQHHGGFNPLKNEWVPASSLVQFREIWVRKIGEKAAKLELDDIFFASNEFTNIEVSSIGDCGSSSEYSRTVVQELSESQIPELRVNGLDSPLGQEILQQDADIVYVKE